MDVERLEALFSDRGRELLDRLAGERVDAGTALRLGARLRAEYPTQLVTDALGQAELRQRAAEKFVRAGEMFFTRDGLEQASAEPVARYRARRFAGDEVVADLCTGIGGDLVPLADGAAVTAVDIDPVHLRIATANAEALGVGDNVTPVLGDARDVDLHGVEAAFVDPARRSDGRRKRAGDGEPPLDWCVTLAARLERVGVKASPALPREDVPDGWELELIAVGTELKEATLWSPGLRDGTTRRATVLPAGHTLTPVPGDPVPVGEPGDYLVDPNPAVTRAGLVEDLARTLGAWKIDDSIGFLCADEPVRTPFGRTLRVVDSAPWNEKRLRATLRSLDVGAVDIRRRGLAGDVNLVQKRLKLTGSRKMTVVMTRSAGAPWCLVCADLPHVAASLG